MCSQPSKSAPPSAAAVHPSATKPSNSVQLHDDEHGPSDREIQQAELLRKRLIFGVGAVPAAASVLGLLGWLWWPFHAMDLFRVQYSVLLLVFIALALWIRQWKAAVLFLLPVLLNAWLISPLFLSPPWAEALRFEHAWSMGESTAMAQQLDRRPVIAVASSDASIEQPTRTESQALEQEAQVESPKLEQTPYGPVQYGTSVGESASPSPADDEENIGRRWRRADDGDAGPDDRAAGISTPDHMDDDVHWPAPSSPERLKTSLSLLLYHCAESPMDEDAPFEFLRSSGADLLVLQGVTPHWIDPLRWRVAPYRVHKSATRGGQFGQAILGRFHYPLDESAIAMSSRQLVMSPANRVPAFETVVSLRQGKVAILSISLPLPLQSDDAQAQAMMLATIGAWARRQTLPVVVVGNLGTTPWSSAFRELLEDAGLENSQVGHGLQATWPAQGGLPFGSIPIDHVLHSPEIVVTQRDLLPAVYSSHRTLMVEFTLDPAAASTSASVEPELAQGVQ